MTKSQIIKANEGRKLNVIGDHQTIKLTGKDTNGLFTLIEQNNPPGTQLPKHMHEREDEVFQLLEGEVEFTVGDTRSVLKAGDTIFLPRMIPHSFKVLGNQNARVILSIFPAGIEGMFELLSQLPDDGPPDFEKVVRICGDYGVKLM
ncbi:cupin domain-containing protein [Limibacter armeniacum]|uniref:cupin domain-containing protein n=1 Tax=Limibacter armeniacum TaxID=466084 RepID=UPI002FE5F25B